LAFPKPPVKSAFCDFHRRKLPSSSFFIQEILYAGNRPEWRRIQRSKCGGQAEDGVILNSHRSTGLTVGASGYDWLLVDSSTTDGVRKLSAMLCAIPRRAKSMVRVTATATVLASQALDFGRDGVLVRTLIRAEEARQAIRLREISDGRDSVGIFSAAKHE